MSLILPPNVEAELVRERQAHDAEVLTMTETARQLEHARRFDVELKRIDPYLELVWVGPLRDVRGELPPGIARERWHVVRHNPDAPDSYMAITTQDGGYREPDSGVLKSLQENDMYSDVARGRAIKRRAKAAEDKQRAKDAESAQDREEVAWRIKAIYNPGINFNPALPWTRRAGTRRG